LVGWLVSYLEVCVLYKCNLSLLSPMRLDLDFFPLIIFGLCGKVKLVYVCVCVLGGGGATYEGTMCAFSQYVRSATVSPLF